jgi:trehalose 6-phosphate synthase/phosphatase
LDASGDDNTARPPAAAAQRDDLQWILRSGVFTSAESMALLIDYDGTLVPYAPTPAAAAPDVPVLQLLESLAEHPRIDLHLVSGRSVDDIARWFGHLAATLWAEHGASVRTVQTGSGWERLVSDRQAWMTTVRSYLTDLTRRTPGSLLEEKQSAMAWHYRLVDPDLAESRVKQLSVELAGILDDAPVELLWGRLALEVRPRGVSKGLVVERVLQSTPPARIIAIGDDRTDEDMFAALPPSGVAIRVGAGATGARYTLSDFRAVRHLLSLALERLGPAPHASSDREASR